MFFPHSLLTLFFCFCLFFSFSYAHYKNNENPTCYCPCAHNNNHENIPTEPSNSSPTDNNNHENTPTKPGNSSPANNNHENTPTKSNNSSPADNNSHKNTPTKPSNSSPADNNSHENTPIKPGNSSPVENNHENTTTKPGNSPPAGNNNHENGNSSPTDNNSHKNTPTKSGNSSPANNSSHENTPTKSGNSSPTDNNSHENTPTKSGNSSPTDNNSHENTPTKSGNSSPADNNSHENTPTKSGNSSPTDNSSHENTPTKPGNSSPANNNSHENTPTKLGNSSPADNNHENTPTKPGDSSPVDNSSHENTSTKSGNSFPADNNSHENTPTKSGNSSPTDNSSHENTPTKPGNSSATKNNSHDTSTSHNNYKGFFHKVYAFGDSYTDTGNANLVGGLNVNFTETSSNSAKSNNALCDGHLVVDFLCDALNLPHLPPFQSTSVNFTTGVNFAIAGSTTLPKEEFSTQKLTNLLWKGIPMNFQTQIDWFNKLKQQMGCTDTAKSCKAELENALFWIGSIGVSDYVRIQGSSLSTSWLTEQSVHQVSRLIEALLESGAKYIVVQGLPPIGCLPLHISLCPVKGALDHMGCAAAVNTAVMVHNQILQRRLEKFRRSYPNCHVLYADYWNAYLTILMNLKKYQFEEAFKPCCGAAGGPLNFNLHSLCGSPGTVKCNDPSKFISWDGIHLSEAMNRKVTDLFLNQGFCQPSFSELVKSKSGM